MRYFEVAAMLVLPRDFRSSKQITTDTERVRSDDVCRSLRHKVFERDRRQANMIVVMTTPHRPCA